MFVSSLWHVGMAQRVIIRDCVEVLKTVNGVFSASVFWSRLSAQLKDCEYVPEEYT